VRLTLKLYRRLPALRLWLAGAVMLALGCSVLMAVSPSFHELVHHDAHEADHQCAVTLLSREHVLSWDNPPVLVAPPSGLSLETVGDERILFHSIPFLLPPGRGPPALS
jgi:hypothetical protein